jgi:tRNA dimethylallyltransferase
MKDKKQKLVIIAGPTAVGKSKFAILLARKINGEIICADSTTVYRGLNIGSAKVKKEEMLGVKHYLIDVADINENYDITRFKKDAASAISEISAKGKIPIIVGGSGFYIQAVLYDIDFTDEDEEEKIKIRNRLEKIVSDNGKEEGSEILFNMLKKVDPLSCKLIEKNNIKRVIRALEFFELHKAPISKHNEKERKKKSKYDYRFYCLSVNRDILYDNINRRVDKMIADGLIDEIRDLIKNGAKKESDAMQSIGYKELYDYVESGIDDNTKLTECIESIKQNSRHYAKRQITWFKNKSDAKWIDMEKYLNELAGYKE